MLLIPIKATPNQQFNVVLGNQQCSVELRTLYDGLFASLYLNSTPIVLNVPCQNLNRLVKDEYLGFVGDLVFSDTQGTSDPEYSGLGSRYLLYYLEPSDL